jgi:hypothetical protein
MFTVRRFRKTSRLRTLLVFAMVPLVVFNGRTVVGCGCHGRFEAQCHCNRDCATGGCSNHDVKSCPCCEKRSQKQHSVPSSTEEHGSASGDGHHCKGIAQHEVTPATVSGAHLTDEIAQPFFTLDSVDEPGLASANASLSGVSEYSHLPPLDRVVVLRRLVI